MTDVHQHKWGDTGFADVEDCEVCGVTKQQCMTELLLECLGLDQDCEETEREYTDVAARFTRKIDRRARTLDLFTATGIPLEEALEQATIEIPGEVVKRWQRIIKGRNVWSTPTP